MKVIIQDIPQEFIGPVKVKHLEEKGIVMCHKGGKVDLEIGKSERRFSLSENRF